MPMFLTRRDPDHVTRPNFLDWAAPTLCPAAASRHDQGLAQWVCMLRRPGAGLEGDTRSHYTRRSGRIKQRINPHRAGKILSRSFAERLRTNSLDVHF